MLHIEEGGVQAGVDGLVKLLLGVLGQGDAGGRVLGVVDQKVDAAQGVRRLLHHGRHLLLHAAIGLAGQHLHAVEPLQLLLGVEAQVNGLLVARPGLCRVGLHALALPVTVTQQAHGPAGAAFGGLSEPIHRLRRVRP